MTHPDFTEEQLLWEKGFTSVIGVDEVGRGSFAGPVVTAAVCFAPFINLPQEFLESVNDSKKLSPNKREYLVPFIQTYAKYYAIGEESVETINSIGIGRATERAFQHALVALQKKIVSLQLTQLFLLIDGFHLSDAPHLPQNKQKAIIKGDQKSISIAAASILAKVYRDNQMKLYDEKFPQYGFGKHKGYGTKHHRQKIKEVGICPIHRTSFDLYSHL